MSADNGIYILRTMEYPTKVDNCYENSFEYEYRVAECQAIDNLDYSDLYLPIYFSDSKVFSSYEEALAFAIEINDKIQEDGYFTEYGICDIEKEIYFPNITRKAAEKALDCYKGCEIVDV